MIERGLDVDGSLLEARILFIMREIKEEVTNDIISKLLVLDAISYDPIEIYINSPGGSVDDGLAIYDVIKAVHSPIVTVCVGNCSSMAAILLSSGEQRYAYQNSSVMIHQAAGGVTGNTDDIKVYSKEIEDTNTRLAKILAKNTGQPLKKILKDIKIDKYMSANEALKYGLIDKIIKSTKK